MRIKKVSQPVVAVGQILNEKSNSEKDTYSAAYIDKITISELSDLNSNFSNIEVNAVVRSGNVVTVDFRGYINENISGNTNYLELPYRVRSSSTFTIWVGDHYSLTSPKWIYVTTRSVSIAGEALTKNQWLHMHFTYITDDD